MAPISRKAKQASAKRPAVKKAHPRRTIDAAERAQLRTADEMLNRIERKNAALLADADRMLKLVS